MIESAVTERDHGAAHVRPPPGGGASHLRLDDPDRQPMLSAVTRSKGNDSVSEARPFRATLSTIEGPAIHEGSLVPAKAIVRRFRVSCPAGSMSQSQSLFRSYGSVLPTSLTYIRLYPEAVHLGDLMRL